MSRKLLTPALLIAAGLIAVAGSMAIADPAEESKLESLDLQLPEGWTAEDMQKCIAAATPGKMHKELARDVGTWNAETTMWMTPESDPMTSTGTSTVKPIMDGRYYHAEMKGDMPGMGPYHGMGVYGYDNVSKEFVSTWIDNHSTGIMTGVGEISDDGKKLSWEYKVNCPVTGKPVTMREEQTFTGPDSKTLEMWSTEPKSGKEYKMMSIKLTRAK